MSLDEKAGAGSDRLSPQKRALLAKLAGGRRQPGSAAGGAAASPGAIRGSGPRCRSRSAGCGSSTRWCPAAPPTTW